MQQLLHDWVTQQAQQRSDNVAIVYREDSMSYGELERLSNQLARTLIYLGCRRGDRVCMLMPKIPTAIAAIIGIYKAGCIYVPLDPTSPVARLTKIIASCDTRWLLTAGASGAACVREMLPQRRLDSPLVVGWLDTEPAGDINESLAFALRDIRGFSKEAFYRTGSSDAAHILFTSGSTGEPKGVIITHANVNLFIHWANRYFGLDESDQLSCHPPLHFDLSMFDLFGAFAAGATVHLVPEELSQDPYKLTAWMRSSRLTQWFSVPSLLNYLATFDTLHFDDMPAMKRLLWCGEVLPTRTLRYWMQHLPHVRFTNLYGPTETTIASSYYTVPTCPPDDNVSIPIGSACEGEELLVLDDDLRPAKPGTTGELFIGGGGLSPGYWRDPEKTRQAFRVGQYGTTTADRFYRTGDLVRMGHDGLLYFLGRVDSQIKSRGYRIELGEIEAALNTLNSIRECAVIALPTDGFEGITIACAYATTAEHAVTAAVLRNELARLLPRYMIPSRWMAFAALPRNGNGKLDRPKLRDSLLKATTTRYATDTARQA